MTRARNIAKLVSEQISGNVNVSGIITAATFFGEGSGITGVSPVGSGVTILDGGVSKGSASKIDFADHFTVSDISSGIATITVGVTTEFIESRQINNAGIITTSSAIVGSAVTIDSSGINATGVVTATTFSGSITGTTGTASTASFATTSYGLTGTPDLNVGVVTATSFVGDLTGNATGLSGVPNIVVNNISASSGIATFEQLDAEGFIQVVGYSTITNGGLQTLGIVTASSFVGDGSQLTGLGNTADVRTSSLVVSGISTFNNTAKFTSGGAGGIGVSLPNTQRIRWGDLGELSIKSDGTTGGISYNYIDATDGNIYVRSDTFIIRNSEGTTERLIAEFNGEPFDGENVKLYYGGNQKFETIGAGVTITGTTFTNQLNVSGISTFGSNVTINGNINASAGIGTFEQLDAEGFIQVVGYSTVTDGGFDSVGVVTSLKGFTSGSSSPVEITVVGSQLIFNVVGIGSTTLTLA